jgi:hypothetical protein
MHHRIHLPGLLLLLAACSSGQRPSTFHVDTSRCEPCRIDDIAAQLAGPGAEDCGWARARGEHARVRACALEAAGAGRPFRALVTQQGIDSTVVEGYVRTPRGELAHLLYDSNPSGGPAACSALVTRTACSRLTGEAGGEGRPRCEGEERRVPVCDERARLAAEASDAQDARYLACNPLPSPGRNAYCVRLAEPSGNIPEGLRLTCEPFATDVPAYLVCRQRSDLRTH